MRIVGKPYYAYFRPKAAWSPTRYSVPYSGVDGWHGWRCVGGEAENSCFFPVTALAGGPRSECYIGHTPHDV